LDLVNDLTTGRKHPMTTQLPFDIYLRLSDARIEEALDGRETRVRAFAAVRGIEVRRVVTENDLMPARADGSLPSATAFKRRKITTPSGEVKMRVIRPGFRAVLSDIQARRIGGMLAEDLDRAVRDPRDLEDLVDACELSRGSALSISGSLSLTDGGTDSEITLARVMVAFANKSSRDTRRRVSGRRAELAGKSYGGGRRPYGYVPDPEGTKYHRSLIIVPEEAEEISQASHAILCLGVSLKARAVELRDRRVPTVTGTEWSAKTLHAVLTKPSVAGLAEVEGELVEAPWDAILDRDVCPVCGTSGRGWDALRDLLLDPARRTNTGNANEPRWLLSGFATCGVCQGRTKVLGGSKRRPTYTCAEGQHVRRSAATLDRYIEIAVIEAIDTDAADLLKPPPSVQIDAPKLRAELRRLRKGRKDTRDLMAEGVLTKLEAAADLRKYAAKIEEIERALDVSDLPDPLPEFRPGARGGRTVEQVWEGLTMGRKRAVVRTVIASVVINRTPGRGPRYQIEETVDVQRAA